MWKLLRLVGLIGSVGWAALMVVQANLPESWHSLCGSTSAAQRWALLTLFFLPSVVSQWLDTQGWLAASGPRPPSTAFGRLFTIRLAGEAVNQATPLLPLGGEPVKAALIRVGGREEAGTPTALGAARLALILSQVLFVLGGVALTWLHLHRDPGGVLRFGLFPALLGGVLLALILFGVSLPVRARQSLAARLFRGRWGAVRSLIAGVLATCRERPGGFAAALLWYLLGWAVVAGEFWVVARVLGVSLSAAQALGLEALMGSICMATFFLPGNLGSQEAGLLWVSSLFTVPGPLGPVMVVLRRLRELVWVLVGFLCLALLGGLRAELVRDGAALDRKGAL